MSDGALPQKRGAAPDGLHRYGCRGSRVGLRRDLGAGPARSERRSHRIEHVEHRLLAGLRLAAPRRRVDGLRQGRSKAGSIGHAGCFSFYPGKNLGALGEGGAITTNDPELAQKMRVLRDHGQESKYHHSCIGWNARMDGIQGAALSIKLKALDRGNAARRAHAQLYGELLSSVQGVVTPAVSPAGVPVFHLYVVRVRERDRILAELAKRGIACGIHYPKPVHLQKAYAGLGLGAGTLPVTERCATELLSLPMFPELTPAQVSAVVKELKALLAVEKNPAAASLA